MSFGKALFNLSRRYKTAILMLADFGILCSVFFISILLRYNEIPDTLINNLWLIPVSGLIGIICFHIFRTYQSIVRHIAPSSLLNLLFACITASLLLVAIVYMTRTTELARTVPILFFLLGFLTTAGFRYLIRSVFLSFDNIDKDEVFIYGAGSTGVAMATALINSGQYKIRAFIDQDSSLKGKVIRGIKVYAPETFQSLLSQNKNQYVLLTIPSLEEQERKFLLEELSQYPIRIKNIPTVNRIVSGLSLADLPDVNIESLLERPPVTPNQELLTQNIFQKTIFISGAGGSIGSELVRQVLAQKPKQLIALDHSELAIYRLNQEHHNQPLLKTVLGSVTNSKLINQLFSDYQIDTVYHAAAYKHVPIIEDNILIGVENNILGTWIIANAAQQTQVSNFTLISSDKAVRPTNVMGATKRFAEICIQYLAEQTDNNTLFSMVRFGNVLGSSGSVIPLFKQQIATGGPITVTDKEMIRYFMTIPEATQLVIQAGAMAEGGDVFLLDMGEPVKIDHLARRMVHLMGYAIKSKENPNGDIEIHYSGIRPGEKLYEELLIDSEAAATIHPRIFKADEPYNHTLVPEWLDSLQDAINNNNKLSAIKTLNQSVNGFENKI